MSVLQNLRGLFRWGRQGPPKRRRSDQANYGPTPVSMYRDSLKFPQDRVKQYDAYDELDETIPQVASVLHAYAEDATQYDQEKQATLWVESDIRENAEECNHLLRRLETEESIEALARDLARLGDDFARLLFYDPEKDPTNSKHGVLSLEWADPRSIERVENEAGVLLGFIDTFRMGMSQVDPDLMFKPWDFVHYRIRTRKYVTALGGNVYGTSMLKDAHRPGKQLKMLSDMLMIYRLTKTSDRRTIKVNTGNAAPEEQKVIVDQFRHVYTRAYWRDTISGDVSELWDPLSFDEDIFVPFKEGMENIVDTIPGNPNIADLADFERKDSELFGALRAPKQYFGFGSEVDASKPASAADIRFARLVKKLQRAIMQGYLRMFQIHLALRGMSYEAKSLRLRMVEPSAIEQIHRLEALQIKIDMGLRMVEMGDAMHLDPVQWRVHILRTIFGFSDDDLKKYFKPGLGTQDRQGLSEAFQQALLQKLQKFLGEDSYHLEEEPALLPSTEQFEMLREFKGSPPPHLVVGGHLFERKGKLFLPTGHPGSELQGQAEPGE